MKLKINYAFVIFIILLSARSYSQGYYFNLGKNFTKYDYKNSFGQRNSNIQSDSGWLIDFGYQWKISSDDKWQYKAGLSYQQFNAKGNNDTFNYSWVTNYLGIQNNLAFTLYNTEDDDVSIKINGGFTASKIIKGTQMINNISYDLTKEEEFKGLFIQPMLGIENEFKINEFLQLGLGYRFSKAFRINSNSEEQLNFITNSFFINLKYHLF